MSELPPLDTWGQPGHLNDSQQEALQHFLAQASPANLDLAKFRVESLESVALRFLRARSFNVANALTLLTECAKKKTEGQARKWATCTPDECADCDVEALKIWYPHAILGFDRYNRPLFLELSGRADGNAIRQMTTMERLVNYHWYTMENVLNALFEQASQQGSLTISTCAILDMQHMNSHHMSSKVLELVQGLIAVDNVCYPELLGKMLVINAPWLAVSLWEMVKHWLDPRTQAKIEILGSGAETTRRLLDFVAPTTLPPSLGGAAAVDLLQTLVRHAQRPLTDYVHVPRYGGVRKVVSVARGRLLVLESYTVEGELELEVFSHDPSSSSIPTTATAAAAAASSPAQDNISMADIQKLRSTPSSLHPHLVCKRDLKNTATHVQSHAHPLRTVVNIPAQETDKVYEVVWINTARFYTRPLVYNIVVHDAPPSPTVSSDEASRL